MPESKKIDPQQVRHIARLARIELPDEQLDRFTEQLAETLQAFDKLQELDTEAVQPLVHPIELHTVLAEDAVGVSLSPEAALANAPARDGDYFKVPKVIGDSQ